MKIAWLSCLLLVAGCAGLPNGSSAAANPGRAPAVATFSIVAADTATGEVGVAVASKFVAVGSVVPWAKAGVGAVATQSYANTTYGPEGLAMLAEGVAPRDVVMRLTDADARRARRQLGVVNAAGQAASYTGADCLAWAGGRTGPGYAVQGNILAGPGVVDAMAMAYEAAAEAGQPLPDRLVAALQAGQTAGGDTRGRQSAALLVVREGWGYAGLNDRFRDLRVDDHPRPIEELARLLRVHQRVFRRPR